MFKCVQCGNCCRHPGYVRLRRNEVDRIADHLNIPVYEFTAGYTRLTRERGELSLIERPDGACCFLSRVGLCEINVVKPEQCRNFPLKWNYRGFKQDCHGAAEA